MTDPVLGVTEQWDTDALTEIEQALLADEGLTIRIPRPFRCRTGAVPGTKGTSKKVLSYYLTPDKTEDGVGQFYVSPYVGDSGDAIRLLAKLAAESLGWAGSGYKHRRSYCRGVTETTFGIKWTTRTPIPEDDDQDPKLRRLIPRIIHDLGPRPHGAVALPEVIRTPKVTALLKAYCPYCNQPVRATLSALQRAWPVCVGNGRHPAVYLVADANAGDEAAYHFAHEHFPTNRDANNYACP